MESKITIDIDPSGFPQLRIDYRLTGDLRDRLIGRFLSKMGIPDDRTGFWAYCRLGTEVQSKKDGTYDSAVVYIEPMDDQILSTHIPGIEDVFGGREEMDYVKALNIVSKACANILPHEDYKKWHDAVFVK